MLEGVKRNVIKTYIKGEYYNENEECDSFNTMETIDDYNLFINTPQSSYSDNSDDLMILMILMILMFLYNIQKKNRKDC